MLHQTMPRSIQLTQPAQTTVCPLKRHASSNVCAKRRERLPAPALGSFGSSVYGAKASNRDWQVPEQLLPTGKPIDQSVQAGTSGKSSVSTVYTLRLSTSWDRGSAITEPMAGVQVCLVSKQGTAVLHRIPPVNDPKDRLTVMRDICSSVGDEVGADCSILASLDDGNSLGKEPKIKQRFQEGSVDEVSFMAPELGPLAAIMVAPQGGSWVCDEVDVYSSRSNHTDRFVCRQRLGGRKGEPAAYLTPVPPNAVVYGTGDAASIISKEQAAALKSMGLSDYESLKSRLLLATALLTAGGSGIAAITVGPDAAVPFAVGGLAGLLYQLLLQLGADAAVAQAAATSPGSFDAARSSGSGVSAAVTSFSAAAARSRGARVPAGTMVPQFMAEPVSQEGFQGRMLRVLGSAPFRLLLLSTAALLGIWLVQENTMDVAEGARSLQLKLRPVDAWQLGLGLCGFLMFKVAVLGVSLSTPDNAQLPNRAEHLEKNVQ